LSVCSIIHPAIHLSLYLSLISLPRWLARYTRTSICLYLWFCLWLYVYRSLDGRVYRHSDKTVYSSSTLADIQWSLASSFDCSIQLSFKQFSSARRSHSLPLGYRDVFERAVVCKNVSMEWLSAEVLAGYGNCLSSISLKVSAGFLLECDQMQLQVICDRSMQSVAGRTVCKRNTARTTLENGSNVFEYSFLLFWRSGLAASKVKLSYCLSSCIFYVIN
jgi:hypothetical protein